MRLRVFYGVGRLGEAHDLSIWDRLLKYRLAASEDDPLIVHHHDDRLVARYFIGVQQDADVDAERVRDLSHGDRIRNAPAGLPAGDGGAVHKEKVRETLLRKSLVCP